MWPSTIFCYRHSPRFFTQIELQIKLCLGETVARTDLFTRHQNGKCIQFSPQR